MADTDLLGLIERVEKLEGPDREVDESVAASLGWRPVVNPTNMMGLMGRWYDAGGKMTDHYGVPRYTASLDAAMTLVPEGCLFHIQTLWDEEVTAGHAKVTRYRIDGSTRWWDTDFGGVAATPSLALTAAALRARLSIGEA